MAFSLHLPSFPSFSVYVYPRKEVEKGADCKYLLFWAGDNAVHLLNA